MEDPMSSNKIRPHPIKLSKPRIGWLKIFIIMSHQITHRTLILWTITCGAWRGVVEKEINMYPNNTKFYSLMEAIARAVEDINKDHLI
ncbi:hypothetical protein ACTXT7_003822 [Hymenolepis weldensis]